MVASEDVLWCRITKIAPTMAVHFALSLAPRILCHFAGLFVRLLDRDLLLPLTVAEDLEQKPRINKKN